VGVYATLLQSDTLQSYGCVEADTRSVGVEILKKPKDLIVNEREERGHGEEVRVYATLLQSDTAQSCGCAETDTRSVGVDLSKKQRSCSQIQYSHMVSQNQALVL
jgi:hypothetical protein